MIILECFDKVLFVISCFTIVYLLIYAIAANINRTDKYSESRIKHRIAAIFPAYKDDEYILNTVKSFLHQDYPIDCYDIIVISDHLKSETNIQLAQLPIILLKANFKTNSKMKAIKAAMSQLEEGEYDMVVIMNADNMTDDNFLNELNNTYASGSNAIQGHRIHKERNNNVVVLDAIADEINNSILRAGHVNLGLSSSLNGSGMAFDFSWFKKIIKDIQEEEDEKAIEALLLQEHIYVEYLNHTKIYAIREGGKKKFYSKRKNWIKAQYYSMITNITKLPIAILSGNFDYADRILQWIIFPRTILLGIIILFGTIYSIIEWSNSLKWWGLLFALLLTMAIATPNYLVDKRFNKAMKAIPFMAIGMVFNLFFGRKKKMTS